MISSSFLLASSEMDTLDIAENIPSWGFGLLALLVLLLFLQVLLVLHIVLDLALIQMHLLQSMRHPLHLLLLFYELRVVVARLRVRRRHRWLFLLNVELREMRLIIVHLSGIFLLVLVGTEYGVSAFPWVLFHVDGVLRHAVEKWQFRRVCTEHLL